MMKSVIIFSILTASFSYYFSNGFYDIYSNFGAYVPFFNTTTYIDLAKYVIVPFFGKSNKSFHETVLFTGTELKKYNGADDIGIYISILGNVFDVSSGASFYGIGKVYHGFAGRDASRAFITGDFTEDGLTDDVINLPLSDLLHLQDWLKIYKNKYKYKGKLIGRYYDSLGEPTVYSDELKKQILEAEANKNAEDKQKEKFPPCNVEWTADKGSRVWCSTRSGGIERTWVGVPRKLYIPGNASFRCACVNIGSESTTAHDGSETVPTYFTEYESCNSNSASCHVIKT